MLYTSCDGQLSLYCCRISSFESCDTGLRHLTRIAAVDDLQFGRGWRDRGVGKPRERDENTIVRSRQLQHQTLTERTMIVMLLCNLETEQTQTPTVANLQTSLKTLDLLLKGAFDGCGSVNLRLSASNGENLPLQLSFASPNSIFVFSMKNMGFGTSA